MSDTATPDVQTQLKCDYPLLWAMSLDADYDERIGRHVSGIAAEVTEAMHELRRARQTKTTRELKRHHHSA